MISTILKKMTKEDNPKIGAAKPLAVWLAFMVSLSVQGCDFPSDPQVRRVSIPLNAAILGDSAFSPATIHVPLAGQVIWTNDDNIPHSIVGDATEGPCAFESQPFAAEKRFRKAFFGPVRCNYYCGLHGRSMRGRIVVE